jgi:O-antigen/teichoic acid export membrane protein
MIRATATTAVDQAVLSALNLSLALVVIHFAGKQEYGLYAQLLNLQPLFSPVHAGLFASAYLALASRMTGARRAEYCAGMARAELLLTVASAVAIVVICLLGSRALTAPLTITSCVALAVATLSLWWREFSRQIAFAAQRFYQALHIDVVYVLVTCAALGGAILTIEMSASVTLWCLGLGGAVAAATPLYQAFRGSRVSALTVRRDVEASWSVGKWESLGSIVTWGYAQSYVYFAAFHGGLEGAAEISASRLLATPLSLMWAAYANVLRPRASLILANGSAQEGHRLANRSAVFVVGSSAAYAILVLALLPVLERTLFAGTFQHLRPLALCWIAYTALTGLTTIAASVLRSALKFRQVLFRHVISCAVAMILLMATLRLEALTSIVIALCVTEALSVFLFWRAMRRALL